MTSRPRVQRLAAHVANQIAAGEVVARPASVVKELVENALDADSRSITVAIEGGGVGLVRVVDDGAGMGREDATLALERHATSKLREFDDLRDLRTLGFRGEALPSIASVSRFTLRTRTAGEDEGTELTVEGNGEFSLRPCGTPIGTTIEVRDLFFNVPARRKFLRALATESAHVGDAVRETAFAHPGVQFELWRDGRMHKRWLRARDEGERARDILGDEATLRVADTRGPLTIEAYLSPPERVRSGAAGLTILVNRRPVQDRAIARAVAAAYGDRIERGKYPFGVVLLELPTADCDVNVHPQKSEVRFSEPRAVSDAVFGAVQRALSLATTSVPDSSTARGHDGPSFSPTPYAKPASTWARHPQASPIHETREPWSWNGPLDGAAARPTESREPPSRTELHRGALVEHALTWVAELEGCILGRDARHVFFVDRRAALVRITSHRAHGELQAGALASTPLLFPQHVELSVPSVAALDEHHDTLERLGFEVRAVGPRTVALHAVASVWQGASAEALVRLALEARASLETTEGVAAFLTQASELAVGEAHATREPQALLDQWHAALDGADPRDAEATRHHLAVSELAPRPRRV